MDIGIPDAGRLDGTLAQLLVESNREVAIASNNGVGSLKDLPEMLGPRLCLVGPKQAVRFGDVAFLVIPFRERDSLPDAARFAEEIVVDAMNPYTENFHVIDLGDGTSSKLVASQPSDARLVRSPNTIHWETLRGLGHPDLPESERLAVFLAGDGSDAETRVAGLTRDIGLSPVGVGGLVSGGELLESGSTLYRHRITTEETQDTVQTLRARQGRPSPS